MPESGERTQKSGRVEYNETHIPSFLHHVVSFRPDRELGMTVTGYAVEQGLHLPNLTEDKRNRWEAVARRAREMQTIIQTVVHELGYDDELQPGSDFLRQSVALRGYVKEGRNFLAWLADAEAAVAEASSPSANRAMANDLEKFQEHLAVLRAIGTQEAADRIVDRYAEIERTVWLALYRGPIAEGRMTIEDL